jgi:ankyrin repeat protein
MLLEYGADVNLGKPLLVAVDRFVVTEIMELLLQHGADPNATNKQGEAPLFKAVAWQCLFEEQAEFTPEQRQHPSQIIELLLQHGADLTSDAGGHTTKCISLVIPWNRPVILELMLRHGADPNVRAAAPGETPLFRAVLWN